MKCMHCNGEMTRSLAPFHVDRLGYHLSLDAVPAWVCSQCGEAYFAEAVVETIEEAIQVIDNQTKKLAMSA